MQGDITSQLVDGADRFLLAEIEKSVAARARFWKRDFGSPEKYELSVKPNRERLAHILGVRDPRVAFDALELLATTAQPGVVGEGTGFRAYAVRWPAFADVHGEGLLLVPTGPKRADVIALPDADQTPEMIAGLAPGVPAESQFGRRLAESGCQVLIPVLIDRQMMEPRPGTKITHREYIYRSAFELGRHVIGYELQKVLAAVDYFSRKSAGGTDKKGARIGVIGWGNGGMLALSAGALDTHIAAVCVSGYFNRRENVWREPLDHNVFAPVGAVRRRRAGRHDCSPALTHRGSSGARGRDSAGTGRGTGADCHAGARRRAPGVPPRSGDGGTLATIAAP